MTAYEPHLPLYEFTEPAFNAAQLVVKPGEHWDKFVDFIRLKHSGMQIAVPFIGGTFLVLDERDDGTVLVTMASTRHFKISHFVIWVSGGLYSSLVEPSDNARAELEQLGLEILPITAEQAGDFAQDVASMLVFLNMPKVSEQTPVCVQKINKARARSSKPLLPAKTVIRPAESMRRYMQFEKDKAEGSTPAHMVGGHWHRYWCGPMGRQWLEPRWVAPFIRGNEKNGIREPRYEVRS